MKLVRETKEFKFENTAITLGKFDGMHRGHMSLVKTVTAYKNMGFVPVLFTFDTSPYEMVKKGATGYLLTREEKYELCRQAGIEVIVEYPFDSETMHMDAEDFVREVLIRKLDAKKIVVGEDFGFGKNRMGNVDTLRKMFPDDSLDIKNKITYEGNEISSTYIKKCINDGDVSRAAAMLGRKYSLSGTIIEGKKIGRTIDFPTINLKTDEKKILPASGVYATETLIDGRRYAGVTNIGSNPTVTDEKSIKTETHLLGCDENLYGKTATVKFVMRIRGEKKFDNILQLKEQISKDVKTASQNLQKMCP